MRNQKVEITQIILGQLNHIDNYKNISLDTVISRWWFTGRTGKGLRLTKEGSDAFDLAEIEHYNFDWEITRNVDYKILLLDMSKKIHCPYYIGFDWQKKHSKPYIRLYDSKITMMLSLYGNIQDYLNSIKV